MSPLKGLVITQGAHSASKSGLARVGRGLDRTSCAAEGLAGLPAKEQHGYDDHGCDQRHHDPVLDRGCTTLALHVESRGDPRACEARHPQNAHLVTSPLPSGDGRTAAICKVVRLARVGAFELPDVTSGCFGLPGGSVERNLKPL